MPNSMTNAHPINENCPWSGLPVSSDALMSYRGFVIGFCNPGCRDKFLAAVSMFDDLIEKATDTR